MEQYFFNGIQNAIVLKAEKIEKIEYELLARQCVSFYFDILRIEGHIFCLSLLFVKPIGGTGYE